MRTAIYPGSFDPFTNGHLDILRRGLRIFDHVVVAILCNPNKKTMFASNERGDMIEEIIELEKFNFSGHRVSVGSFNGLLVDAAKECNAVAIIRGLRAVSDFEYEFQMALMNRKLNRHIESVYLMTGLKWIFTSSSIVKEALKFKADISDMVPAPVEKRLLEKMNK